MFVQKKYPKIPTMFYVELTEGEVAKIMQEAGVLDDVVLQARRHPNTIAPTICQLLSAIRQANRLPHGC